MKRITKNCFECKSIFRTNKNYDQCKSCRDKIRKRKIIIPIQCEGCAAWHKPKRNIGVNQLFCDPCLKIHNSWASSKHKKGWRFAFIRKQGKQDNPKPKPKLKQADANCHAKAWNRRQKRLDLAIDEPWKHPDLTPAEAWRLRNKLDPEFNLKERVRAMLRKQGKADRNLSHALRRGIKEHSTWPWIVRMVGYTSDDLRKHMERQFTSGMNWQRFFDGDIHIDHIIPRSSFDVTDEEEVKVCWALSNLRPMWAKDNMAKGAKRETLL